MSLFSEQYNQGVYCHKSMNKVEKVQFLHEILQEIVSVKSYY